MPAHRFFRPPNIFLSTPKQIFLLDGLGALLTAFLLGLVLTKFDAYFGMPRKILYPLSALAGVYACYSLTCYFLAGKSWKPLLRAIAIANLMYCVVSAVLLFFYFPLLCPLGLAYFLGEILIIMILACLEIGVLNHALPKQ